MAKIVPLSCNSSCSPALPHAWTVIIACRHHDPDGNMQTAVCLNGCCCRTGHTYNTIEHVFQAQKTALVDPDKARWFTVESGHAIGTGDGHEARKNRFLVLLSEPLIRKWSSMSDDVMAEAARCKYASCDVARQALIATGESELWHVVPGGQAVRFKHLEVLREQFRGQADCSH